MTTQMRCHPERSARLTRTQSKDLDSAGASDALASRAGILRLRRCAPSLRMTALLVAVLVTRATAQSALFTVDRYFDIERVSAPRISPDGNRIVFSRAHADAMADSWAGMLWEMESDGSRQRQLVKGSDAQWSPDGTRIAYLAEVDGKAQLWVRYMDAEGASMQVTHGESSPESLSPIKVRSACPVRSRAITIGS